MADTTAREPSPPMRPATIVERVEPMGDLRRFVIDDLTPDEEDEFFSILEGA